MHERDAEAVNELGRRSQPLVNQCRHWQLPNPEQQPLTLQQRGPCAEEVPTGFYPSVTIWMLLINVLFLLASILWKD